MSDTPHQLWRKREEQRQILLQHIANYSERVLENRDRGNFMVAMALLMVADAIDRQPVENEKN